MRHLPVRISVDAVHRRIGHGANDVGRWSRHKPRTPDARSSSVGQVASAAVPGQHDLKAGIAGQTHQQQNQAGGQVACFI